ncbi:hypothetical protein FUA48_14590 [Flavobacterium alkalisoli]|uniref:Uncharacterized protein n=1 Tax=Flavobacterium alkalisoli TaxID=2602769 RepID=A0A5B9FUW3_9FLAO|nr:hypothetical protein [Flavobacterium alkalisoli]QEE50760.1 hypothetical protein FUA48_14590 [Flavobacterium alkalisoli]
MKKTAALLIITTSLFVSCNDKKNEEVVVPEEKAEKNVTETPSYEKMCFLKVTESKAEYNENRVIRDSIVFELEREGDSISGTFNWLPFEKDKKLSTFKGTLSGNTGNAIADYSAEGMNYKEELVFTLGENQVSIIYGEMIEGEDGIWKYKNKEAASTQTLSKVDCK